MYHLALEKGGYAVFPRKELWKLHKEVKHEENSRMYAVSTICIK